MENGSKSIENLSSKEDHRKKVEMELFDDVVQQQGESDDDQEDQGSVEQGKLQGYQLAKDRARRKIKTQARCARAKVFSFALNAAEVTNNFEPRSYKEAVTSSDKEKWMAVMDDEMQSLEKNNTWILAKKTRETKISGM